MPHLDPSLPLARQGWQLKEISSWENGVVASRSMFFLKMSIYKRQAIMRGNIVVKGDKGAFVYDDPFKLKLVRGINSSRAPEDQPFPV